MIKEILSIFGGLVGSSEFLSLFKGKERKLQEFQLALIKELEKANFQQIELNKVEARHKSIFVSGWRPFIGWVCGSALLYHFIFRDLAMWFLTVIGLSLEPLPALELGQLISIIFGMLGMSGYRTYEKVKKIV